MSLQFPGGALETTTEEITRGGFSVQGAGLAGDTTPLGFVVHLPDGQLSSGSATSSTRVQAHGTGFSCTFSAGEAAWTQFVDHEQNGAGLWQLISRLATRLDANTVDHLHVAPSMRLHTLGENAEACRIAFEKQPAEAPEVSTLSTSSPTLLELAQRTVSRLLTQDARLVELLKGGFGYVAHQDGGKLALMGLHGSELLVTEVDGAPVFPFFTPEDLERIACDTLRLTHPEPRAPAPVEDAALRSDHFAAAYEHTAVDSRATVPCTREQLRAAMRASLRALLLRVGERVVLGPVLDRSARLAFSAVLSLAPFMVVLTSLAGFVPSAGAVERLLSRAEGLMPAEAFHQVSGVVHDVVERVGAALGVEVGAEAVAWGLIRWPVAAASLGTLAALAYRVLPDMRPRAGATAWGASVATVLFLASSRLFSLYAERFADFGPTYGSLTGVVLLLWSWLTAIAFIVGGEVTAAIPGARARREP